MHPMGFPQFRAHTVYQGLQWLDIRSLKGQNLENCVCVARCAFIDEAEKLENEFDKVLSTSSEAYNSRRNVDLWKEWGKQTASA